MSGENKFSRFLGCIIPCRKKTPPKSKTDQPTKIQQNTSIQIHKVDFTWTIDDFDFHIMNKSTMKSYEFWAITNEESKWRLTIQPSNRVCKIHKNYETLIILLYFIPARKDDKVLAKSDISICNSQQKRLWKGEVSLRKFEYTMVCGLSGIRFKKKNISPSNKLTVCCNLTYTKIHDSSNRNSTPIEEAAPPSPRQLEIPQSEHLEKFASLYNEDLFADVLLSIGETHYTAHKAILAAHSPVFSKMFEANAKKGRVVRINISGIDEQVIGEMLRYIYTGSCENLENIADGLMIAADRYGLNRLKMICANALVQKLCVENATDILVLADKRGLNELKTEVIKYITAKYMEISNQEAWQNAIKKKPQLVNEVNQELCRRQSFGYDSDYVRKELRLYS
ncbi:speckle-type POZ protein-like [Planococcus citri]|uniref:speckle-type POZ protein-like n=1 Tax=Planococcus citri TaxID=170843 RepID=UPI0031F76A91